MENTIKIMDSVLASKIAAGGVVERPASVVKELIENSLDAGATEVNIFLTEGGIKSIKVVDNGQGLSKVDLPLAFERHATSKLSSVEDLEGIQTMGFRGEALPSIASISKVTLKSRQVGSELGVSIRVDGGGRPVILDAGLPEGTIVQVNDIFFNTPARQKFLRTPSTEFGRVLELIRRTALSRPDVRFRLSNGSSTAIDTPSGTLSERVRDIFGSEVLEDLVELDPSRITEGASLSGFVARPERCYPTGKNLFTYVNGRFVRDKSITRAVSLGYAGMIDRGRYPFVVIDLKIPGGEVDVNVHPAKTEVRFRRPSFIFDIIKGGVGLALARAGAKKREGGDFSDLSGATREAYSPPVTRGYAPRFGSSVHVASEVASNWAEAESTQGAVLPEIMDGGKAIQEPLFLELQVIGQLWGEFILAETKGSLCIIDQHAAAERIRFEELKAAFYGREQVRSQYLLVPERFETTPEERDALVRAVPTLTGLGFEITSFGASLKEGGETFIVKALPELLAGRSVGKLLREVAEETANYGGSTSVNEALDAVLMRIACHSVIRGSRALNPEEARALLRDMSEIDFSAHCPHGRPVMREFTREELETVFKRR